MLGDVPALAADVAARILAEVPGLDAPEVAELVGTMCEANGAMVLDGLVRDIELEAVEATPDFLRWTQAIAQHRIPLPSLLRAYRVSHARWWEIWTEQVDARVPPEEAPAVVAAGSRYLFAWVDLLSDQATIEYLDEARRLARQASVAQAAFVRGVLNADPDDLAGASRRLGYDLGGRHLAAVLKAPAGEEMTDALLERAARGLADACGAGRPLAVLVDSRTAWVWVAIGADVETPRTVERTGARRRRPARPRPGRLPRQPRRGARGLADRRADRAPAGQRDPLRAPSSWRRCAPATSTRAGASCAPTSARWRSPTTRAAACSPRCRRSSARAPTTAPRRGASASTTTRSSTA